MKLNKERLFNIREAFAENKIDALFLTSMENIRYLSDFSGSSAFILITKGNAFFITDFRYKTQAENEIRNYNILIYKNSIIDELNRVAEKKKLSHIGVEKKNITLELYQKLTKGLKKAKIIPTLDLVERFRAVKDPCEIGNIIKSVKRAEKSYSKIRPKIKEGVSERGAALDLEFFIKEAGSRRIPFEIIVASGSRSSLPHAISGNRRLRKNDLVIIDFGADYKGYCSDITRTSFLGIHVNRKVRKVYNTVLNAQYEAIDLIRPGIKAGDVDAAARRVISKAGYGSFFGHGTGHGIGLMVHEAPSISPRSGDILKEGMVFTVEPAIYLPGWGGVRIEDMVQVTKNGCRLLTSLPKEI